MNRWLSGNIDFRNFTLWLVWLLLLVPLGWTSEQAVPPAREYRLHLYHTHTGERLDIVYRRGDTYLTGALDELDHYLRDHRTGEVRHFDPRLFDVLYDLTASLNDTGGEIDVVCGYRTPWSNEFLRSRSAHTGVDPQPSHAGRSDRHLLARDFDGRRSGCRVAATTRGSGLLSRFRLRSRGCGARAPLV